MSFAYNCGVQGFKNSTLLKKINANQLDEVPNQLVLLPSEMTQF